MQSIAAVELKNVSKEYPGAKALDNVSFRVTKGRVHGFLGPNGAGKTTSMKIICGLIPPNQGSVFVGGIDVVRERRKTIGMIGFLPETPPLYDSMRVCEYLEFAGRIHGLNNTDIVSALKKTIEKCGLGEVERRLVGNLSKGYRQRVGIAQALLHNPEVIILDEPTSGLDPVAIVSIRDLIHSLKKEHTIILSSHQLHEVSLVCSEITIIDHGKILKSGEMAEIQKSFQTCQVIHAEVLNWKESLRTELCRDFSCDSMEINSIGESTGLKFHVSLHEDLRPRLSEFLIRNNCGLLSFGREQVNLEDIFKQLTIN